MLAVTWEEKGGPAIKPPSRKGFGASLIEKGIANAAVRREFRPEGLICTIELFLSDAQNKVDA